MRRLLSLPRYVVGIVCLALISCAQPPLAPEDDLTIDVRLTFYLPTGKPMYNGTWPYPGAAACSWDIPLGTMFATAHGDLLICGDRGELPEKWVDVYVSNENEGQRIVESLGSSTRLRVLQWGEDVTGVPPLELLSGGRTR